MEVLAEHPLQGDEQTAEQPTCVMKRRFSLLRSSKGCYTHHKRRHKTCVLRLIMTTRHEAPIRRQRRTSIQGLAGARFPPLRSDSPRQPGVVRPFFGVSAAKPSARRRPWMIAGSGPSRAQRSPGETSPWKRTFLRTNATYPVYCVWTSATASAGWLAGCCCCCCLSPSAERK